jgi:flavin reductase (DIM6/NTAB) family NADH-FMN oxidoreductase RutF/rubredoxin
MTDFHAFYKLSYGLYLICSEFEGKKTGYAGNTGFQVTAEPSTIAISCNKNNFSCGIIEKRNAFSLSVLKRDLDVALVGRFGFKSGKDFNKFDDLQYETGELDLPVITESCVAAFECKVISKVDVGSHILFIGEVINGRVLSDEPPLTYDYYHTHYKMLSPKNAPTYIDPALLDTPKVEEKPVETNGMQEYICSICGYVYDPEEGEPSMGIPPGTAFDDLPDDFECPICKATKEYFSAH